MASAASGPVRSSSKVATPETPAFIRPAASFTNDIENASAWQPETAKTYAASTKPGSAAWQFSSVNIRSATLGTKLPVTVTAARSLISPIPTGVSTSVEATGNSPADSTLAADINPDAGGDFQKPSCYPTAVAAATPGSTGHLKCEVSGVGWQFKMDAASG